MSWSTGTATNHTDLFDKFVTFVTTSLGSQNWTKLADETSPADADFSVARRVYFRAPGLSGTDEVYSVFRLLNPQSDAFNIRINALGGYSAADKNNVPAQPGVSPGKMLRLSDFGMTYWFFANGRRAIIVAKVSTVYQHAYVGLYTPYGSPSEIPYPHFVGGVGTTASTRWSVTGDQNNAYWRGYQAAAVRETNGNWLDVEQHSGGESASNTYANPSGSRVQIWPWGMNAGKEFKPLIGAGYALMPGTIRSPVNGGNVFGELDGVFHVAGFGNASENTITIAGATYIVFQNVQRTQPLDYCAILAE